MSKETRPQDDAEDAFIQEIENALRNDGGPGSISAPPETDEELPHQPFRFVLHHLQYYRWILISIALLELGQAACQILIPKAVQRIIDAATASGVGSTLSVWTALGGPLKLFILLNLGILIFSRASGSALVMVGPSLRRRVRQSLYRYLQGHSQRYFMGNFAGSLSNRIAEVSLSVNQSVWTVMFDFWPVIVTLSVSLIVLAEVHSGLALVLGTWSLVYVAVSYVLAIRCREYARKFAAARSAVSGKIVDAVTNVMNSKLFARNNFERGYLRRYLDQEVKTARRTFWFMERMRWFQFIATLSLQVGMIVYSARLWMDRSISVGSFAMVASLLLLVINDIRNLSRRFLEFFEYIGNVADGVGIIIRPHEITDLPEAQDLTVSRGEIRFEKVKFSYPGGMDVFD